MTTLTLTPNATAAGASLFTISGGAASAHAALSSVSDAADASSLLRTHAASAARLTLDLTTSTLPAAVKVTRLRWVLKHNRPTSARITLDLRVDVPATADRAAYIHLMQSAYELVGSSGGTVTTTGPWVNFTTPDGWTEQETLDALRASIADYSTARTTLRQISVEVEYTSVPDAEVTAPTGTVTLTAAPEITWTYSDADGGTQLAYQVEVVAAAGEGATVYDSGWVYDSGTSHTPTSALPISGDFYATMTVLKDYEGYAVYSVRDLDTLSAFTMDVSGPTPPVVSAVWNHTTQAVDITITGTLDVGYSDLSFNISCSDSRGASVTVDADGDDDATFTDYAAPRDALLTYSVTATGTNAGIRITGEATEVAVSTPSDGQHWLKPHAAPALNAPVVWINPPVQITREAADTVYRPLDSTVSVVVTGDVYGQDMPLTLRAVGEDEWAALEPILLHTGPMLLQDCDGSQVWINLHGQRQISREAIPRGGERVFRRVAQVNAVEVARP